MNQGQAPPADAQDQSDSEDLSRTFVLNALRDLCGGPPVIADEASREVVADAFEAAVTPADRDRFRDRLEAIRDRPESDLSEEDQRFLLDFAADVLDVLAARGTTATLVHEARLSVPPREAAVYSFMVGADPAVLQTFPMPEAVADPVSAGAEAFADGDFETAIERFDEAIDESAGGDGAIAARVLAGAACQRAGRDADAMDYVEETLHLETRAWTAKLVGYAADHRFPEKFREGKLGSRVFLRWAAGLPETGEVEAAVGPADGSEEPRPLTGSPECQPIDRLWPETTVRVSVTGQLPDVPNVETYYVATGVADLEVFEARTVEQVLLSGPSSADATERLRFE